MSPPPHIVVDVGNSRIKWGRVEFDGIVAKSSLPLDDEPSWNRQSADWKIGSSTHWTVSGVNPAAILRFQSWLRTLGCAFKTIDGFAQLNLRIDVEEPARVGLDRLFNVLAVPTRPALIVDAGSAVTVDAAGGDGAFLGGCIIPGLRLAASALHRNTASLPQISRLNDQPPAFPARNTEDAMRFGVVHAVQGAIESALAAGQVHLGESVPVYWTGGDAAFLRRYSAFPGQELPYLTLQGILIASGSKVLSAKS